MQPKPRRAAGRLSDTDGHDLSEREAVAPRRRLHAGNPRLETPGSLLSMFPRRLRASALAVGLILFATVIGGAALPASQNGVDEAPAPAAPAKPAATASATERATAAPEFSDLLRTSDRVSRGERPEPMAPVPLPMPAAASPSASTTPAIPVPSPPAPAPATPEIAGIPNPCPIDLPITAEMSTADIARRAEQQWGFRLTGSQWRDDAYRPVVELFAETLDAVDCTGYLDRVRSGNGGTLDISSNRTRSSWAWGDYGLTRPNVLTLDFAKFRQGYAEGDRGRLVRLIIHELAHSLNADRHAEPAYWRSFNRVWSSQGPVSAYGSNRTESFADAVGYYVARCAADNPYAGVGHVAYYDFVKNDIFGGREFGGAVGTPQTCSIKGR